MHVKSPEVSNARWIRRSIMAYLEAQKDLKWIVGVIGGQVVQARDELARLADHGDRIRFHELLNWCKREYPVSSL